MNAKKENEKVLQAIERVKREAKEKVMEGNLSMEEIEKVVEKTVWEIDKIERKGSHNMLYQQMVMLAELSEKSNDIDTQIKLTDAMVKAHRSIMGC